MKIYFLLNNVAKPTLDLPGQTQEDADYILNQLDDGTDYIDLKVTSSFPKSRIYKRHIVAVFVEE